MKTTVDIPDAELADIMRYSGAHTKKEAISLAVAEFNRRYRMAKLAKELRGSCKKLMTAKELESLRSPP